MNAICGIYARKSRPDAEETELVLTELGDGYRFDRTKAFREGPLFLGCRLNCVTPESLNEELPYEDRETALVITADAVIYNREELFGLLSIPGERRNMPDSLLILEAYQRWGIKCPERLIGDFAFVIWDRRSNELFCARDHVGKRTFYYCDSQDAFAFSTLMEPLFRLGRLNRRLNDVYIADFLAMTRVCHELTDSMTIYEDIFPLPPACAMIVNKDGIKKWRYWEMKRTQTIRFKTDAEYEAAFREVYSEAVRCRLRSAKKVGIMLSGGLDSGSIACLAAPELKKRGEKLYGFTQVPMESYRDWLPKSWIADEREYVEEECGFTGNIEPHYLAAGGRSPLTEIDDEIKFLEQPYKIFGTSFWINEIQRTAAGRGIGVMLTGQTGNYTVSWGDFSAYTAYLRKTGRWVTLFKELAAYRRLKNIDPLEQFRGFLLDFMPYALRKRRYLKKGGEDRALQLSPINPEFYKRMKVEERFKAYDIIILSLARLDSLGRRMERLSTANLSHLGAVESKLSLAFGVENRDPTRDKRLIEFCLNLPENQWVRNGEERRFIRRAMVGYMPDKVRLNTTVRGRQTADWMQRMMPEWEKVREELATIGDYELERKYLDIPRIKEYLKANQELRDDDDDKSGVRLLIRALIFARFLRSLESTGG